VIAYHRVRVQPARLSAGASGLVSVHHLRPGRLPARLLPLPPLRPRWPLLLRRLHAARAPDHAARRRAAVSAQPARPPPPRRPANPLSRPPRKCDASGFPAGPPVRHRAAAAPHHAERPGGGPWCPRPSSCRPSPVRALWSPRPVRPAHHPGPCAATAHAAAL